MTTPTPFLCPCGQPLHYQDQQTRLKVLRQIRKYGRNLKFITPEGAWDVPRHFMALHRFTTDELPGLAIKFGFQKVKP